MTIISKEELLEKGIPEEKADEIISALSTEETADEPLQALQKALGDDPEMDTLFKAKGEDEDSDDDDEKEYDEKYMKKYMKRYMKENKKSCGKMMKDLGDSGEDMKKAIEDVDLDSEGAVIEMTDLKPFLDEQSEFNSEMVKAITSLSETMETIIAQGDKNYDLMEKAARVTAIQAEGLGEFLAKPQGRKAKVVADVDMQKAHSDAKQESAEVYTTLLKAVQNGDRKAGEIIGSFESRGKNVKFLNDAQKSYIQTLRDKEAK